MADEQPTCPKCGTPFMSKAPIYDDHVERCTGPAKAVFGISRYGMTGLTIVGDKYEDAEAIAKEMACRFLGAPFQIHKVFISQ